MRKVRRMSKLRSCNGDHGEQKERHEYTGEYDRKHDHAYSIRRPVNGRYFLRPQTG
jgi:hypothetical protein